MSALDRDDHDELVTCIGCGCDDFDACETDSGGACHWLRADEESGRGVCSECPEHVARFDAGDRSMSDDDSSLLLPGDEDYDNTLELLDP